MKTLLLALAMLCATAGTTFAQEQNKTEKKEARKIAKQERLEEQKELVKQMYETESFTFTPNSANTATSGPQIITSYSPLILKPQYLNISLPLPNYHKFQYSTSVFDIVTNETTKNGYKMVINTGILEQKCTLTFTTNVTTGTTTLILNREQWQGYTYRGVISPN